MRPRPPFSSSRSSLLTGCNKIKSKQEIKRGNEFLKAAQYPSALAAYEEALRLDPGETKLNKHIGLAYMGMYQPGSKHPKDLEFAAEGDREPEAVRRRPIPRTRRRSSTSSRCT